MIVCHCYGISDREIRRCVHEGAASVGEVGRACGAGTGCGGCRPEVAELVSAEQRSAAPIRLSLLPGFARQAG